MKTPKLTACLCLGFPKQLGELACKRKLDIVFRPQSVATALRSLQTLEFQQIERTL